jgi:beta-glucosidase
VKTGGVLHQNEGDSGTSDGDGYDMSDDSSQGSATGN